MTGIEFEHIVIVADDLKAATKDFQQMGFHVREGGANGPTENALIVFSDGSYIELIAMRSPVLRKIALMASKLGLMRLLLKLFPVGVRRYLHWFGQPGGVVDIALRTYDIDQLAQAREGKPLVASETIRQFQRPGVDGERARWLLGSDLGYEPPFFIEDITDRTLRIPVVGLDEHPNRTIAIVKIELPEEFFGRLKGLFHQPESFVSDLGKVHIVLETVKGESIDLSGSMRYGFRLSLISR